VTFNDTYIDFAESAAALQDEIDDINEQLSDLEEGNPLRPDLTSQRSQLQTQRKGAIWACPSRGEGEDPHEDGDFPMWTEAADGVTLGGVRAGAFAGIEQEATERNGEGTGLLLVADGTVEAPYVDGGMSEQERAAAVGQLHPYFRKWAQARIDEIMNPEGNVIGSSDSPEET
jgi:hypothetical protein